MSLAFEQQPKESAKAFEAFALYLSMGAERSVRAVGERLGKSEGLMERWAAKYGWRDRVSEHAAHLAVVEREATEALARGKAAEWLKRKQAILETDWSVHEECILAARTALARFHAKGNGATLGDIARMFETASKLGRLACGLPTEHTELTGAESGPIQIELSAALNKIYGADASPGREAERDFVDVESTSPPPSPQRGEGKRPMLPEGGR